MSRILCLGTVTKAALKLRLNSTATKIVHRCSCPVHPKAAHSVIPYALTSAPDRPSMLKMTRSQHRWIATAAACVAACLMLGALSAVAQVPTQATIRTLSGQVTDTSHEPIRGAVVELRNEGSNEVVTYLTDANGHYEFKRLDGNADYDVWVVFRGLHSPTRSISKFDSHMAKVINFTVRTF